MRAVRIDYAGDQATSVLLSFSVMWLFIVSALVLVFYCCGADVFVCVNSGLMRELGFPQPLVPILLPLLTARIFLSAYVKCVYVIFGF